MGLPEPKAFSFSIHDPLSITFDCKRDRTYSVLTGFFSDKSAEAANRGSPHSAIGFYYCLSYLLFLLIMTLATNPRLSFQLIVCHPVFLYTLSYLIIIILLRSLRSLRNSYHYYIFPSSLLRLFRCTLCSPTPRETQTPHGSDSKSDQPAWTREL